MVTVTEAIVRAGGDGACRNESRMAVGGSKFEHSMFDLQLASADQVLRAEERASKLTW